MDKMSVIERPRTRSSVHDGVNGDISPLQNSSVGAVLFLFYWWGHWDTEKSSGISESTLCNSWTSCGKWCLRPCTCLLVLESRPECGRFLPRLVLFGALQRENQFLGKMKSHPKTENFNEKPEWKWRGKPVVSPVTATEPGWAGGWGLMLPSPVSKANRCSGQKNIWKPSTPHHQGTLLEGGVSLQGSCVIICNYSAVYIFFLGPEPSRFQKWKELTWTGIHLTALLGW